jgi:hypothetical protein
MGFSAAWVKPVAVKNKTKQMPKTTTDNFFCLISDLLLL